MSDNELIAEFMGLQVYQTREEMMAVPMEKMRTWAYSAKLAYHKEWNDLMPVVERIESLKFSFMIVGQYSRINKPHPFKEFSTNICATKIESVYTAVVQFIKWYNQQPKP